MQPGVDEDSKTEDIAHRSMLNAVSALELRLQVCNITYISEILIGLELQYVLIHDPSNLFEFIAAIQFHLKVICIILHVFSLIELAKHKQLWVSSI